MSSVHENVIPFPNTAKDISGISPEVADAMQPAQSVVAKIPVTLNLSPKQLGVIAAALANDNRAPKELAA